MTLWSEGADSELAVVPGAAHVSGERGALEQVAALAAAWFARHPGAGMSRATA